MTMGMGLDCWEWEAHESSQLWLWWCLKLEIIVAKLLSLLHNKTRTPYAFPTWRCHVLGYHGPLKFFKFGWLLGLCLATKLYTHRGITLLNYKDSPSTLSSSFEVHMPLFGSIPKGVTNEQMRSYKPKSFKDSFQLKKQIKMGVLLQLYPCCKLLPLFYNNISNVKTKTNIIVTSKHYVDLLCFKKIHLQTAKIHVQNTQNNHMFL